MDRAKVAFAKSQLRGKKGKIRYFINININIITNDPLSTRLFL